MKRDTVHLRSGEEVSSEEARARGRDRLSGNLYLFLEAALSSSAYSCALLRRDGSIVTYGDAAAGGDSRSVQGRLKNVQAVTSARQGSAFAAMLDDGSVVAWGDPNRGGSIDRAVQDQLKNVRQIQAGRSSFAAIKADGSVVTWGLEAGGGRQQLGSGAFGEGASHPNHRRCFCRHLRKWLCRDMGRPSMRRQIY